MGADLPRRATEADDAVPLIRHTTVMGDREGLREAVLLGKSWGMTHDYIVNTIVQSVHSYFERLNMVEEVLQDVL